MKLISAVCKLLLGFALTFGVLLLGLAYVAYVNVIDQTPIEEKIIEIKSDVDYVSLNDIEDIFLNSIVAVEDHRFYNHLGIDPISIARASVVNFKEGKIVQGGSTITQQLVKNLYLENDRSYDRKIKEMFIAIELERNYSKDEILELYVNAIYYGDGYYGIKEASLGYFGKLPEDLTFDEATLLAGLPQSPSAYALSNNYDRAVIRQQQVINALANK